MRLAKIVFILVYSVKNPFKGLCGMECFNFKFFLF